MNLLDEQPPDPPALPAPRFRYHNGRRWKLETQGRANRRARRDYRRRLARYQWRQANPQAALEEDMKMASFEMRAAGHQIPSLYDLLMSRNPPVTPDPSYTCVMQPQPGPPDLSPHTDTVHFNPPTP